MYYSRANAPFCTLLGLERRVYYVLNISEENVQKRLRHISPAQIVLGSFMLLILAGALLLMLPISSQSRQFTPFIAALFTATSATCVTGLVVVDTATYWSFCC